MFRVFAALLAASAAVALAPAVPAAAAANCPAGCFVYQLTAEVTTARALPGQVALAAPNNPVSGSRLTLRALNTDRAFEQFLYVPATRELVLAGTDLCVTGNAAAARVANCSAGTIYRSQAWTLTAGSWANGYGRRLSVNSVTLGSPVLTSATARAVWAALPATS